MGEILKRKGLTILLLIEWKQACIQKYGNTLIPYKYILSSNIPMKDKYTVSLESNDDSTMSQEFTSKKEAKKRAVENGQPVYNTVTCGNCGGDILHDAQEDYLACPHCLIVVDQSDFTDLF